MCCSAYVVVRYHISELFIFTDFAKSCGSLGHGPSALAVCCGHMCCCMLLHGTAARCSHLGFWASCHGHLMLCLLGHCQVLQLFCLGCMGSA
jgi:hypothetical protein